MTDRERRIRVAHRARERYGLLLISILSAFAVQGIAQPGPWEEVLVTVLLALTLLLALWASDARPRVTRVLAFIALIIVATSVAAAIKGEVDAAGSRFANLLLVTMAPPTIVIGVLRSLRARQHVSIEAVFGVLCLYILLGMAFSFLYGAIGRVGNGFFAGGEPDTVSRCLYYSFTTLTTVGYGDLTAAGNLGHTLSVFEALIGQIYLVTIVSLFVANLRRGRPESQ
jgi:Ion channel